MSPPSTRKRLLAMLSVATIHGVTDRRKGAGDDRRMAPVGSGVKRGFEGP